MRATYTHANLRDVYRSILDEMRKRPHSPEGDMIEGEVRKVIAALARLHHVAAEEGWPEAAVAFEIDTEA